MSPGAAHTHLAAPYMLTRSRPTAAVHALQTDDTLHEAHLQSTRSRSTKKSDADQHKLRRPKRNASTTTLTPSPHPTKVRLSTVPCPSHSSRTRKKTAAADIDVNRAVIIIIETVTQTHAPNRLAPIATAIAPSSVAARGAGACTRTLRAVLRRRQPRRMRIRRESPVIVAGDARSTMLGMRSVGVGLGGAGDLESGLHCVWGQYPELHWGCSGNHLEALEGVSGSVHCSFIHRGKRVSFVTW